jgi:diguanylate cyclase (GGDEF)-like protein
VVDRPEALLTELFRAIRIWGADGRIEQLLNRITADALQLASFENCLLFLLENTGIVLRARAQNGSNSGAEEEFYARIAQRVADSGRTIVAHEADAAGAFRQVCCMPLIGNRGILGALYLDAKKREREFTNQDQEFAEMIALHAAMAIEHAMLYHSAITDPLTGLFSHRHFQIEVEQGIRRAIRSEQPVTMILIDLDRFKELNDTCGHAVGNECLTAVSALLRDTLRSTDVVARFGGDEFEVLLPETGGEAGLRVAEKLREKILELPKLGSIQVTGTIGVASFPQHAGDGAQLFLRADEALYEAKESGRNRCILAKKASESSQSLLSAERPDGVALRNSPRFRRAGDRETQTAQAVRPGELTEQIDGHPLVKRLGMGSNGEVLLVRQIDLDRDVALKRPLTAHLTAEQAAGFEQEARITASLNHPGVISVYTTGRDVDGRRYYTMRPLEGHSLAHILDGHKRGDMQFVQEYTVRRLLEILQRASETLSYAHRRGVAHLDISPSNIVIGSYGEVTIIDWGMGAHSSRKSSAAAADTDRKFTYLVGSPAYMAPEHIPALGRRPGVEADVFSLGAMVYEVLTGQPPYVRATAQETLKALTNGDVRPPDVLRPDAGIDPLLTELTLQSLLPDPSKRPTALEFSQRLGRYVRREADWKTIRFSDRDHALRADDWTVFNGQWRLQDGVWIAGNDLYQSESHCLMWNYPVRGSFRFTVEAWNDSQHSQELSLLARRLDRHVKGPQSGYSFHVGCDFNTYSKFSRSGAVTLTRRGALIQPGKRHIIQMEYKESEARLECSFDGQLIFSYREMFMFPGDRIGLYTWGQSKSYFRPLELRHETWAFEIPVIRLADGLFSQGAYEAAAHRYAELAERMPSRMEGLEARLKQALCYSNMKMSADAEKILNTLRGTAMEPYALIESARICFQRLEPSSGQPTYQWRDGEQAVELCSRVLNEFPESQARSNLYELEKCFAWKALELNPNFEDEMSLRVRMHKLCSRTCDPPGNTQVWSSSWHVRALMKQAKWEEAWQESQAFERRMIPGQSVEGGVQILKYAAALALGRFDLLPLEPEAFMFWGGMSGGIEAESPTWVVLHSAVHTQTLPALIQQYSDEPKECWATEDRAVAVLQAMLAVNDPTGALNWFDKPSWLRERLLHRPAFGAALLEARQTDAFERFMARSELAAQDDRILKHFCTTLRARLALETRQFDAAARTLDGVSLPLVRSFNCDSIIFQAFLSSLGFLKSPSRAQMPDLAEHHLAGIELELAQMFLGLKPPVPSERWPHPLWRPEWRLWLALWLEARGDHKAAYAVALPSRDERYGMINSQPGITQLLGRCKIADV